MRPENDRYRGEAYGAAGIMQGGVFFAPPGDKSYRQSILGYSNTQIVFLVSGDEYRVAEMESTLRAFGVTDALQNDGGRSARLVTRGDAEHDIRQNRFPVGDRQIAYGIGLVPIAHVSRCTNVNDSSGSLFGRLCISPSSYGYDAQFHILDDGSNRCGDFQFNLVDETGRVTSDLGAFPVCTFDARTRSYFFEVGTLNGCAKVHLHQRTGDEFGKNEWIAGACAGDGGGGGGGGTGRIFSYVRDGVVYLSGEFEDASPVHWSYSLGEGTDAAASCSFSDPNGLMTTFTCNRPGSYIVTLTVDGGSTYTTVVRIVNQAPVVKISNLTPWQLFNVATPVSLQASISDTPFDTHTCSIDWDDGTSDEFAAASGGCNSSHHYAAAGMYTVRVRGQDNYGANDEDQVLLVVYDPSAGSSDANGSFPSPSGAYPDDPNASLETWFHLTARYYPADFAVPVGTGKTWIPGTNLRVDAGSNGLDWLVVAPDGKIAAKGRGTIQGRSGSYGFVFYGYVGCGQQSAAGCQPGPDRFRVVVWDLAAGPNPGRALLYDDNADASYDLDQAEPQELKSGIVTIHPPT